MTCMFVENIGAEKFLEEARQVHALREIGRFYGHELATAEDLQALLKDLESSATH